MRAGVPCVQGLPVLGVTGAPRGGENLQSGRNPLIATLWSCIRLRLLPAQPKWNHLPGREFERAHIKGYPMPRLAQRQLALAALLALIMLSACETIQGAGRDMQSAGAAVTAESQDVQSGM